MVAPQMTSLMLLNLSILIYIGKAEALQGKDLNRLDLKNESFLVLIFFHLILLTDFV